MSSALVVQVPSIGKADRETLFDLRRRLEGELGRVTEISLRFDHCARLTPQAVTVLGGVCRLAESAGCKVSMIWSSCSNTLLNSLSRSGFARAFGANTALGSVHAIPYREDKSKDADGIAEYLRAKWLGRGWVKVSPGLSHAIVGRMWEIYTNAFDHGRSDVAIVTCGHHSTASKELTLTVADFGVGIPVNVIEHFKRDLPHNLALEWAFRRGTSTKQGARGLGLDLLKQFVKLNDGRLEYYSGRAVAVVSKVEESFTLGPSEFKGALVTITLKCDDKYYHLASEVQPALPLF